MIRRLIFITLLCLFASACMAPKPDPVGMKAVASVNSLSNSTASGVVNFEQVEGAIKVTARFEGLSPNAKHGFHIHEFGDLTNSEGKSAGSHFNPDGHKHGLHTEYEKHMGDLGNIRTDENGKALFTFIIPNASISVGKYAILGRSVIIHEKEDDGMGAAGNAGPRIAGGIIGHKFVER
jgi:Cu-Zn family superoxide dismutase